MNPRCLRIPLFSSDASVAPAPLTGYSPPAPTPAIPRAMISIQNIPVSVSPFAAVDRMMPKTSSAVVATAPVFRPSWSAMTPNINMPTIIPIRNAFDRRVYMELVNDSGYRIASRSSTLPITAALLRALVGEVSYREEQTYYPSEPIARPEKMTIMITEPLL